MTLEMVTDVRMSEAAAGWSPTRPLTTSGPVEEAHVMADSHSIDPRKERQREYARQWRAKNREKLRRYYEQYRSDHPELKTYHANYYQTKERHRRGPLTDAQRAKRRERWARNREQINAARREWRAKNRERAIEMERRSRQKHARKKKQRDREYRRKYPEKYRASIAAAKAAKPELYRMIGRASVARRRSRMRAAPVELVSLDAVFARDQMRCHLCGGLVEKADRTIDHLIPVVRGGAYAEWNLMTAHELCNKGRGARQILPEETREAAAAYVVARNAQIAEAGL
jgi:hypothetical protein